MDSRLRKKYKSLKQQFITFRGVQTIADIFVFSFFTILLYKQTNSFLVLANYNLVYFIAIFLGLVFGSFIVDRIGYLYTYRTAYLGVAITSIIIAFSTHNISEIYILLGILIGLPRGLFWAVHNSFKLKDLHKMKRVEVFGTIQLINILARIFIPVITGYIIIKTGGYKVVSLIGASLYLILTLVPWKYNKKSRSKITGKEVTHIFKNNAFKTFAFVQFFRGFVETLVVFFISIVPYLLLKNELNVGLLSSVAGLLGVIVIMKGKKGKIDKRIKNGYKFFIPNAVLTLLFNIFWNVPLLIIRRLVKEVFFSWGLTIRDDLDYRNREQLLGSRSQESALELNLIVEALYVLARIGALALMIFLFNIYSDNISLVIRVLWGILSFRYFVEFFIQVKLKKQLE